MTNREDKYFADLISDLKAIKHSEVLHVRKEFQQDLRKGLLNQAKITKKEQSVSFAEILYKWKYLFASVPTMAIVLILAVAVLDRPINLTSPETILLENNMTNQNNFIQPEDSINSQTDQSNIQNTALRSSETIQTFPSYLALPPADVIEEYYESLRADEEEQFEFEEVNLISDINSWQSDFLAPELELRRNLNTINNELQEQPTQTNIPVINNQIESPRNNIVFEDLNRSLDDVRSNYREPEIKNTDNSRDIIQENEEQEFEEIEKQQEDQNQISENQIINSSQEQQQNEEIDYQELEELIEIAEENEKQRTEQIFEDLNNINDNQFPVYNGGIKENETNNELESVEQNVYKIPKLDESRKLNMEEIKIMLDNSNNTQSSQEVIFSYDGEYSNELKDLIESNFGSINEWPLNSDIEIENLGKGRYKAKVTIANSTRILIIERKDQKFSIVTQITN